MLRSDLCEYSDAYIVVEGDITVEGTDDRDKHNRIFFLKKYCTINFLHFKN